MKLKQTPRNMSLSLISAPLKYRNTPTTTFTFIPLFHSFLYLYISLSLSQTKVAINQQINKPPNFTFGIPELANSKSCLEEDQHCNKRAITDLYKAFLSNDTHTMHRLLAPDMEWWFHGPPCHRHLLIPLLTGSSSSSSSSSSQKPLVPDLIVGFGSVTVAEGYDEANMVWWVHAWTTVDGTITEVREYVNTSVTVTRLGFHAPQLSSQTVAASTCQCIWQSKLCDGSVPGLILAI